MSDKDREDLMTQEANRKTKSPLVSVVMPVYNGVRFVQEAVSSILQQTFCDFELLIIDDCSTDGSFPLLKEIARNDQRIRLFHNNRNLGISKTRNKGIQLSRGKYIAVLDCDDIAMPDRLEKQVSFLEDHPHFGLITGNLIIIDENSREIGHRRYPSEDEAIRRVMLRYNPFAQPASMYRRSLCDSVGMYREDMTSCADYDLFLRFAAVAKVANLPEYLIKYRISSTQVKHRHLKLNIKLTIETQNRAVREYGLSDSILNRLYRTALKCLLFVPDPVVITLFRFLFYRR